MNLRQAYIMISLRIIFIERINYCLQVLLIPKKIGLGSINKQGFNIVLFDVIRISFLYAEKIIVRNFLFV